MLFLKYLIFSKNKKNIVQKGKKKQYFFLSWSI